jgi:PAS domain S-box-containing protein
MSASRFKAMTLRRKTMLVVAITIAALVIILYLISRVFLLDSARRLEEQSVRQAVARASQVLDEESASLQTVAVNWSSWDDTYAFIKSASPGYVAANFNDEAFSGLRLNFLALVDRQGDLIYGTTIDPSDQRGPLSAAEVAALRQEEHVWRHDSAESVIRGVVTWADEPMIIASLPVLPSSGRGQILGALIVGRFLDSRELRYLSAARQTSFEILPLKGPGAGAEAQARLVSLLNTPSQAMVMPQSDGVYLGYGLVRTVEGDPAFVVRVDVPGRVYAASQGTLRNFILAITLIGPVFGVVTVLLLEQLVLARLATLMGDVKRVAASGSPTLRVAVKGGADELGSLAMSINGMLSALESSHADLARANSQNEQLLTAISSILIAVDSDERITRWNDSAERTFGAYAWQVLGADIHDSGIVWEFETVSSSVARCRAENRSVTVSSLRYRRLDGKDGFLETTVSPFDGLSTGRPGFLLLAEDITERIALEAQLGEAQKLRAIGQLAAGIAHEINTPCQYVNDNITFLRESCAELLPMQQAVRQSVNETKESSIGPVIDADAFAYYAEEMPAAIERASEGMSRISQIVQAMREFSHPGSREKVPVDINRAIMSTLTVARNEYKRVADLVTDFQPDLPRLTCMAGELNQVILNLVVNAAHAIADATENAAKGKGQITIRTCAADGWLDIYVVDSGTGIPEEVRNRVFEPFFTTKEVGKGTGQGLALAYHVVVEQHGGMITFESEMGKGTSFRIRLPLVPVGLETQNSDKERVA